MMSGLGGEHARAAVLLGLVGRRCRRVPAVSWFFTHLYPLIAQALLTFKT
jgi:hypothetical protein